MSREIALYIHIPFCISKCHYCSFVSYPHRESDIPVYIATLKKELIRRSNGEHLSSIYFGGGTPSLLSPEQIEDLLSTVDSRFIVDKKAEVTIEANPGTVDPAYLTAVRSLGINRLSLGVQSLNGGELSLLGRIHTRDLARKAMRFARDAGFTNLNIDLIYGLPGQTLQDWRETLAEALAMKPDHLSLYSLTLEPGTPLWEQIENLRLPEIDPDLTADQYEYAEEFLSKHSYDHYEISNWAKPGKECRHNLAYWQNQPYLGIGVAAHSHVNGHRLANTSSLDRYMTALSALDLSVLDMDEEIPPDLHLAETVILGLRLRNGIRIDDILSRFGVDVLTQYAWHIDELSGSGLLEHDERHMKLTPRGRLLSNEVFWRFLPDTVTALNSTL